MAPAFAYLREGLLHLLLARLDAGQVQPQIGPVNIGALITRMAALYDAAATSRGLRCGTGVANTGSSPRREVGSAR